MLFCLGRFGRFSAVSRVADSLLVDSRSGDWREKTFLSGTGPGGGGGV